VLLNFDFGKATADSDELLAQCFCNNLTYKDVLARRKTVVVGDAGAGKTAFFVMLTVDNPVFKFQNKAEKEQFIVPINQDLNYKLIKSQVLPKINSSIKEEVTLYRYVWEVYVLYRTSVILLKKLNDIDPDLKDILDKVVKSFSIESDKPTIFELFSSNKNTISFKIEPTEYLLPVPEVSLSTEPSGTPASTGKINFIDVDKVKQEINSFLRRNDAVIYILLDNLDDFVIKEEYETQKQVLEALLLSHKDYGKFNNIKLLPFIRRDLYEHIDMGEVGGQKINSQKGELHWYPEDIREFIARRILWNLEYVFPKNEELIFEIDDQDFLLYEKNKQKPDVSKIGDIVKKLKSWLGLNNSESAHYSARKMNLTDKINRDLITLIFPNYVKHINSKGEIDDINIFEYFSSHFSLGTGESTPRIMVMYLDKILEEARKYLSKNPDEANEEIEVTATSEFPLIKKRYLFDAYVSLQSLIWDSLIEETKPEEWRNYLRVLRRKFKTESVVSTKRFQKHLKPTDIAKLGKFIGYCTHKGVLTCTNPGVDQNERIYNVPLLFQEKHNTYEP